MKDTETELRKQQEEISRLKKQVADLAQQVKRDPYVMAQNIFGYLTFLREYYAGGQDFQVRFQDTLQILRAWGKGEWAHRGMLGPGKFFVGLADLLEETNKPGDWPGLKDGG